MPKTDVHYLGVHDRYAFSEAYTGEAVDVSVKLCLSCDRTLPADENFRKAGKGRQGEQRYHARCKECAAKPRELFLIEGPPVTDLERDVREWAACKGSPSHASYTGTDSLGRQIRLRDELLAVCDVCPVKLECGELGEVIEAGFFRPSQLVDISPRNVLTGIWGGESPIMRARRRRKERDEGTVEVQ